METSHVAIYLAVGVLIGIGFLHLYATAVARGAMKKAIGINVAVLAIHSLVYGMGFIPSLAISCASLGASIWVLGRGATTVVAESEPKGVSALAVLFALISGMYLSSIELSIGTLPLVAVSIIPALISKKLWYRYAVMCVVYAAITISYYSFLNEFIAQSG